MKKTSSIMLSSILATAAVMGAGTGIAYESKWSKFKKDVATGMAQAAKDSSDIF